MSNPKIGGCVPLGLQALKDFKALKIGEVALIDLPDNRDDSLEMARYCRENGIYVLLSEFTQRGGHERRRSPSLSKQDLEEIICTFGEFFLGRYAMAESGGILYWPKAYTIGRKVQCYENMKPCKTMLEAHRAYVEYIRNFIDYERKQVADVGDLVGEDASLRFPNIVECGFDSICLEFLPGNPYRMLPGIRGTARAYSKKWGIHIAMGWYGGIRIDALWLKRWKLSILESFLSGGEYICMESGHYALYPRDQKERYDFDSGEMKTTRRILREFTLFKKFHTRPDGGPETPFAFVHGNHDGTPGVWNRYAWGQYESGPEWLEGPAEKSWELTDLLFRRDNPYNEYFQGDESFSGNPPLGNYDILPAAAPQEHWNRYSCLVFLGYNLMTDEIHAKCVEYVRQGGKIILWLPHCNTDPVRGATPVKTFRGGDLSELFGVTVEGVKPEDVWGYKFIRDTEIPGWEIPARSANRDPSFLGNVLPAKVKITSTDTRILASFSDYARENMEILDTRPALVEHRLGKGFAWLVNAFNYPGDDGMSRFAETLIRIALRGEQQELRLLSSDSVRYAVYRAEGFKVIYLLNTEFDLPQPVRLWFNGSESPIRTIPPAEMILFYFADGLLIMPESRYAELTRTNENEFSLVSPEKMTVHLCNLGKQERTFSFNGKTDSLSPSETIAVVYEGKDGPADDGYLEEPDLNIQNLKLPY